MSLSSDAGKAQEGPLIFDDNEEVQQLWWKNFGDSTLDILVAEALKSNISLAITKTRIAEARAERLAAFSILFPQANLIADANKGNQGFYTNNTLIAYQDVNIQINWEIDLFGKNQARLGAANARIQSAEAARYAVMVSLLADVARNYFDLRNFERQLAITQENLESQKRTLELTRDQFNGGLASRFDVERSGAQVSSTESLILVLQINYTTTRNRINNLLGASPGAYDDLLKTAEPLKPLDPYILISAPATVLATRPDVRQAERLFAANISEHEAAVKELLPTVSLLTFFGVQWSTLFNPIATYNLAVNLMQPLINFGRIEANIYATDARQLRTFLEYKQTVLTALEEMENALANYLYETVRNASLTAAANQNRSAMELARQQYTNGYNSLLDVLIVQRNTLESESNQAASDAKLRKDLVNIYTAAGGDWAN